MNNQSLQQYANKKQLKKERATVRQASNQPNKRAEISARRFAISFFRNVWDKQAEKDRLTWNELIKLLQDFDVRESKDGELFSPARFKDRLRKKENVIDLSLLVLDYDHGITIAAAREMWDAQKTAYALCTTHSHQRITDSHPQPEDCFRVVIPLSEPIPADEFLYLWEWANRVSEGKLDPACKDVSRFYYLPAVFGEDSPREFHRNKDKSAQPLDWRPIVRAERERQEAEARKAEEEKQRKEAAKIEAKQRPKAVAVASSEPVKNGLRSAHLGTQSFGNNESSSIAVGQREAALIDIDGSRPGDDFNRRGDVRPLLEKDGWNHTGNDDKGEVWTRPGKDGGISAHLFADSRAFHVFTSNAPPFEINETYTPFAVFTLLEHGGDYKAAARALATDGFGEHRAQANASYSSSRFYVNDSGVYARAEKEGASDVWLCSPLRITARTRDENSSEWGRLLEWKDSDGKPHQWAMPMSALAGDGSEVRARLLSEGLRITTSRIGRELFNSYLLSSEPGEMARNASRIGWHSGVYILPDEAVGEAEGERIILQSNVDDYRLNVRGSLEDWQKNVGRYCEGNSRLLFAASVAFAAPLLRPLGQEGGGFHFRGQSSKGKSTTTIVAGSIYGGGDPTLGFARTWANTANALEATAEMHNDGLLILDELARCDPKEAGNIAYMLASGEGKGRLQSSIKMRKPFKWQLMFLSTGEISLSDHVAQAGKRVRAGQEVRLCDLPADTGLYGVFENLHGFADGASFAKMLQQNARAFYGSPLRAFIGKLTQDDLDSIKRDYQRFEQFFVDEAKKSANEAEPQVSGEVSRVASRFALVAYAGELATSYGVTGWTKGAAKNAALKLFKEWLDNRGGTGNADEEAAVSQVRQFLAENPNRFERDHNDNRINGKRAGFVIEGATKDRIPFDDGESEDESENESNAEIETEGEMKYCIFADVFKAEVCAGYDAKMVAQALHKRGFLEKGKDGKFSVTKYSPTEKRPVRVYVVSNAIFEV